MFIDLLHSQSGTKWIKTRALDNLLTTSTFKDIMFITCSEWPAFYSQELQKKGSKQWEWFHVLSFFLLHYKIPTPPSWSDASPQDLDLENIYKYYCKKRSYQIETFEWSPTTIMLSEKKKDRLGYQEIIV